MLTPVIRTVFDDEYTLASSCFFKMMDSPPVSVTVCVSPSSVRREIVSAFLDTLTALTAEVLPRALAVSSVVGDSTSL